MPLLRVGEAMAPSTCKMRIRLNVCLADGQALRKLAAHQGLSGTPGGTAWAPDATMTQCGLVEGSQVFVVDIEHATEGSAPDSGSQRTPKVATSQVRSSRTPDCRSAGAAKPLKSSSSHGQPTGKGASQGSHHKPHAEEAATAADAAGAAAATAVSVVVGPIEVRDLSKADELMVALRAVRDGSQAEGRVSEYDVYVTNANGVVCNEKNGDAPKPTGPYYLREIYPNKAAQEAHGKESAALAAFHKAKSALADFKDSNRAVDIPRATVTEGAVVSEVVFLAGVHRPAISAQGAGGKETVAMDAAAAKAAEEEEEEEEGSATESAAQERPPAGLFTPRDNPRYDPMPERGHRPWNDEDAFIKGAAGSVYGAQPHTNSTCDPVVALTAAAASQPVTGPSSRRKSFLSQLYTDGASFRATVPGDANDMSSCSPSRGSVSASASPSGTVTESAPTERTNPESLPAGWFKVESKSEPGEFYYHNDVTGGSQWEYPTEPAMTRAQELSPSSPDASSAASPPTAAATNSEAAGSAAATSISDEAALDPLEEAQLKYAKSFKELAEFSPPPEPPAQPLYRTGVCAICLRSDKPFGFPLPQPVLVCASCNIPVHPHCYGLPMSTKWNGQVHEDGQVVANQEWFCRRCVSTRGPHVTTACGIKLNM